MSHFKKGERQNSRQKKCGQHTLTAQKLLNPLGGVNNQEWVNYSEHYP